MGSKKLKITLVHSAIGRNEKQRRTLKALGLSKLNQTVIKDDRPEIRGMVNKLKHLLDVEEIEAEEV
ncbi:MAG TPA: 50S ribosomal protein L30 [Peptococcaceae bacterium]|nr:MAG: 50S ribosomal protein L30 [Clostridia bacterium 41_269]HBT20953.1 50S ribosomal protein L30 [Peptococcaceae bacterium]